MHSGGEGNPPVQLVLGDVEERLVVVGPGLPGVGAAGKSSSGGGGSEQAVPAGVGLAAERERGGRRIAQQGNKASACAQRCTRATQPKALRSQSRRRCP